MSSKFYILSIDGGGFKGVYSAYILKEMEEKLGVHWENHFDMFAGTSTGSILAGGLACGISAKELHTLYVKHGYDIFTKKWHSKINIFGLNKALASSYSRTPLKNILQKTFKNKRLGQIKKPLIIPTVDLTKGGVFLRKSSYDSEFTRDKEVLVSDAILSSCAAPTFFDPHESAPYLHADGGLWANNPSLVAAIDAKRRLGINLEDMRILSIGTGTSKIAYPFNHTSTVNKIKNKICGWGLVTKWGIEKFIGTIMNLQSESAHNMLRLLFQSDNKEPEQLLRINFSRDTALPMDEPNLLKDLNAQADNDFTFNSSTIRDFLSLDTRKAN